MIGSVDLSPAHRAIVERILKEHVQQCEVRAFGSRVAWTAKDFSDLDLAIVDEGPLPWQVLSRLKEAFEESPLPMRVDVLDWHAISESFRKLIERDYVVVQDRSAQTTAGEWCKHDVRELIDEKALVIGDGYRAKNTELSRAGLPFARAGNIGNGFQFSGADCFPEDELHKVGEKVSRPGDTVFTSKGTVGRFAFVKSDTPRFVYSPQLSYWRPLNTKIIEPRFLYYWMSSEEFFSQFKSVAGQTDMAEYVSLRDQRQMHITLPPLPEQRAIAHVLGTLDDKIELNRRMNETLEEMARALFKSWFVDFDPVRAKAALKQQALRQHATLDGEPSGNGDTPSAFRYHSPPAGEPGGDDDDDDPSAFRHHSPLEGESDRRGALAPSIRWGETQHGYSTWEEIQRSYSKKTLEQAKALRQRQTDAEGLLWHYVRKKQLGGYKFRRQQPIGPYIVDFACMSEKLLVELDGGQHAKRAAHDERRDAFLRSKGFRVLRFWNNEVFENCFGVLERVYEALPSPPPRQTEPADSTAATPPQGGSDGTPSPDSTPSPLKGEGWGGGDPSKGQGEGGVAPAPAGEWAVERARAYLASMDPEIVDLFPDRLVDSELGEIPEGWEVKGLDDIADFTNGLALQRFPPEGDKWLPVVKIAEMRRGYSDKTGRASANIDPRYIVEDGDLLFSWSGSLELVFWAHGRGALNQHLFKVTSNEFPQWFYWGWTREHLDDFRAIAAGKATTMGHIQRHHLTDAKVVVPPAHAIASGATLIGALLDQHVGHALQSRALAIQRDALLPRLVSGEIGLKEVQSK